MPGLIVRNAPRASFWWVRAAAWRQLLLMLCLLCATGLSWAQATGVSQNEDGSITGSEMDAILNGTEITRRVLGGDNSVSGDWPSVVALVSPGIASLKNRFFCGGTIVADRWIMTAAHCLFDPFRGLYTASEIRVVAGIHDLVKDADREEVVVTNIILHPDYDNSIESPPNDIALLELATVLDAPVGELFAGESEDYTGTIGYIVGWGATRFTNDEATEFPTIQQEAPVPLVSLATCNSPDSYDGLIAVTQQCAGYVDGQIDTCAGDSGGPLYVVEYGRVVQVGITSFGNGCGQAFFYGIYTNVSHYIPWLSNYIPVPEQSAELIARREAGITGGTINKSSGAMHPLYLLLIVGVSLLRQCGCSAQTLKNSPVWRFGKGRKRVLVVPIALLLSACTAPSISAQANSTHTPELPRQENTHMAEANSLMLNGDSLRSGIDGLSLGTALEDLDTHLSKAHWQNPVCTAGKTALRGTGRLFQTDYCSANANGVIELQGHQVSNLELFFLDRQLVRMDVVLSSSSTGELSGDPSLDLKDVLNDTYQQTGVALQSKENEAIWSWRHQDDQIQLYPERSLQFIDGRLESSLPALYEFAPPFIGS